MLNLLVIKERIKQIYSKHEQILTPGLKFLLALCSVIVINLNTGFSQGVSNPVVMIVISLICAFLPLNIDILIFLLVMLVQLYALSPEIALTTLLIMLVIYLLYFRFTLKDSLVVILLPILFVLKIPFLIPLVLGLISTPLSIISVTFGTVLYFILDYVNNNGALINNMSVDSGVTKMTMVLEGVINNKLFILTVISFSVILVIVYLVRRLSVDHAPLLAVIAGGIANIIIMLSGYLVFNLMENLSIVFVIIGSVISIGIAYILQFFMLSMDYSRTEYTQFEDDEYYYYVKAVPKINVKVPEVNVKRINVQRTKRKR